MMTSYSLEFPVGYSPFCSLRSAISSAPRGFVCVHCEDSLIITAIDESISLKFKEPLQVNSLRFGKELPYYSSWTQDGQFIAVGREVSFLLKIRF